MSKYLQGTWTLTIHLTLLIFTSLTFAQNDVTIEASKDNTLYEDDDGSLSNGAGPNFFVGRVSFTGQGEIRRAVIAFDLESSDIPEGAIVESATLTLTMDRTSSGSQTITLHRVLADWGEGTSNATTSGGGGGGGGQGAPATSGDATWIHRFFDTETWTTPGGDFSSTVSASQNVAGVDTYTWGSTAEMVEDVQTWLDNPSENFGWILIGNENSSNTSKRFQSREGSNVPVLTVTFTTTSVEDDPNAIPAKFALAQNYPNPFNPTTVIRYAIPQSANVKLEIFNVLGEKVRTLINGQQAVGSYTAQWDGRDDAGKLLTSGVYIYRLQAGQFVESKKMIFVQ